MLHDDITASSRTNRSVMLYHPSKPVTHKAIMILYFNGGQIGRFSLAQQWVRDEVTASGLLDVTIPNKLFQEIKNLDTMMEVWVKLKELFEGKLRSVMVDLGRKFQTTCCGEDNDVCSHFSKLTDLCDKWAALGRAVSNDECVAVLIGSLPPSYNSPIDSLTSSCDVNNTDITPTAIICTTMQEYERCTLRKENKAQDEVFTTTTADKKANKKDAECFNCKCKGHYKSECWRKGGGKEGQRLKKDKDKDKVNAAEAKASSGDESWVVIIKVNNASNQAPSDMWLAPEICSSLTKNRLEVELYDSSMMCHISPFQHCFTNLQAIPPQLTTAANKGVFYAL